MLHNYKILLNRISAVDIALFFRQLAALLSAGIPIVQSCEILRNTQKNKYFQHIITSLKTQMEAGNELSKCLSQFPKYFDNLTRYLVQIGEQSGALPLLLDRIALHKEKLLSIKNKIKQALFYPLLVMIVATVVTLIMLTVIIPRFAELFQSMHSSLPIFTLMVIHLSKVISTYYWLSVVPLLVIFLLIYYFHCSATFRCRIEHYFLRIPYAGTLYRKSTLSRFCRTLAITFAAGIPINESLKTIAYANNSYLYAQTTLKLQAHIIKGKQLHQAMQHHFFFFPSLVIQMVKIGEESGTLEKMLEKIANLYEADIDYFVSNFERVLEPLIIAILGVLIGGLVVAMYLPIFKLGTVM